MTIVYTGPKYPSACNSSGGGVAWTNCSGTYSPGGTQASAQLDTGDETAILTVNSFGFTASDVPSGATIKEVKVECKVRADKTGAEIFNNTLLITDRNGAAVCGGKDDGTYWPTDGSWYYINETWVDCASISRTDVLNSNFGVKFAAEQTDDGVDGAKALVDYISIDVGYET